MTKKSKEKNIQAVEIQDKENSVSSTTIPRTVTDTIPYNNVYVNGIIEINSGVFSKSYQLPDMNFNIVNDKEQQTIATQYSDFICSFDPDIKIQFTLYNKTIDLEEFQNNVLLPMKPDNLNDFRQEYNDMVLSKMSNSKNNLITEKFLTITLHAFDIFEATEKFEKLDEMVLNDLGQITKTKIKPMSLVDRLELMNIIYNQEDAVSLKEKRIINGKEIQSFTLENCAKQGITTKEVIGPSSFSFTNKIGTVGNRLVKSFYICNYPTWIKSTILTDFANISTNVLVNTYFNPIEQGEAIKLVRRQGVNVSSKIVETQKKSVRKGIDPELIAPSDQEAKDEIKELLDSMTKDNVKLFTVSFIVTLFAQDVEEMKNYESQLKMIANKHLVTVKPLDFQQENAFASAMPIGNNKLLIERLMTSLSIASIIPFNVKEITQTNGLYYGVNAWSKNLILFNRKFQMNPNACILGMPGAGKSFAAKKEMINVLLGTEDEVYVVDPEREYCPIAEAMGGSIVKIKAGSKIHINPFDLNIENTDEDGDPVKVKCDFIRSICEIMIGGKYGLSQVEESIIDRCVLEIYQPYLDYLKKTGKTQDFEKAPTMVDFYHSLQNQVQTEAQYLALALERYVKGSLDIFSHHTNIDISNRFTVFDLKDVGSGLTELASQICFDHIWNKMIENKAKNKFTWIYIDEFHWLMQKPTSAQYISQIWKRARKWNGIPCAITQNVEDMLKSEESRQVINNCIFTMLLGQSPINKIQLSEMFGLSSAEQKYISTSISGLGLIKIMEDIVPVEDSFPVNTKLYQLMTTKPEDRL